MSEVFPVSVSFAAPDEVSAMAAVLTFNRIRKGLLDEAMATLPPSLRDYLNDHVGTWWGHATLRGDTMVVIDFSFRDLAVRDGFATVTAVQGDR